MEAPLVSLEEEFEEGPGDDGGTPQRTADPALAELESFSAEMMSFKSMEDLVQEFDEKLTVCFRNYDAATEGLAPVRGRLQAQEEEERLQDEEAVSVSALGPCLCRAVPAVPPRRPSLCLLQLCEKEEEEELTERSEQDSGINEEPLLTAEQVIEELEELMQSSPDPEADPEGDEEEEEEEEETEADPILLRELHAFSPAFNNNCSHEGTPCTVHIPSCTVRFVECFTPLNAPTATNARYTGHFPDCTMHFPKSVENTVVVFTNCIMHFPKSTMHVAKRTMQHARFSMEGISSILHSGLRQTFGPTANEKQYLNTVIPYEKKGSPPSVEDLQMLTNILFAMKEGNEKVPTLLTDYILKVLCPT
uniref:Fasciculation and elongation protein zeta 1 n=1 Tax=Buteo japonicus TaxID=224669 RepID=A0A8C0AW63_9AVES